MTEQFQKSGVRDAGFGGRPQRFVAVAVEEVFVTEVEVLVAWVLHTLVDTGPGFARLGLGRCVCHRAGMVLWMAVVVARAFQDGLALYTQMLQSRNLVECVVKKFPASEYCLS